MDLKMDLKMSAAILSKERWVNKTQPSANCVHNSGQLVYLASVVGYHGVTGFDPAFTLLSAKTCPKINTYGPIYFHKSHRYNKKNYA